MFFECSKLCVCQNRTIVFWIAWASLCRLFCSNFIYSKYFCNNHLGCRRDALLNSGVSIGYIILRWSTCLPRFFSWLSNHVSYLKLKKMNVRTFGFCGFYQIWQKVIWQSFFFTANRSFFRADVDHFSLSG